MKKLFLIVLIVLVSLTTVDFVLADWQAYIHAQGRDLGGQYKEDAIIGVGAKAIEVPAPPLPFEYTCSLNIRDSAFSKTLRKSIQAKEKEKKVYSWIIAVDPHGNIGAPVDETAVLTWEPKEFGKGSFKLVQGWEENGTVVIDDMLATTEYKVSGKNQFQHFLIVFTSKYDSDPSIVNIDPTEGGKFDIKDLNDKIIAKVTVPKGGVKNLSKFTFKAHQKQNGSRFIADPVEIKKLTSGEINQEIGIEIAIQADGVFLADLKNGKKKIQYASTIERLRDNTDIKEIPAEDIKKVEDGFIFFTVKHLTAFGIIDSGSDEPTADKSDEGTGGDGGCFIATAAYGSDSHPAVQVLKAFRDKYLLTNSIGKSFVEFYYENAPAAANWIAEHSFVQEIVRGILNPVVSGIKYPMYLLAVLLFSAAFFRYITFYRTVKF